MSSAGNSDGTSLLPSASAATTTRPAAMPVSHGLAPPGAERSTTSANAPR
jgi:hypothetical protein